MDEETKNLEKQLKKELNEKEMLTPLIAERGQPFVDMIYNILHTHGNIKDKYLQLLLSSENIKIYENAFTSNSVNSFMDVETGKVIQKENSTDTYDTYKIFGTNLYENFVTWYIYRKFPSLKSAKDVKIIARLKINFESKFIFPDIARTLNFSQYISSSLYEKTHKEDVLLQYSMLAFIGATSFILDNTLETNGIGYAVCYNILSSFFKNVNITLPSKFDELNNPITVLKEFFDKNKYTIGKLLPYDCTYDKDNNINTCTIYYEKAYVKYQLSQAQNKSKKESERMAAIKGLEVLESKGISIDKKDKVSFKEEGKVRITYGDRSIKFKNNILNLLKESKIKDKYIDVLLSDKNMKLFDYAFTSNSANLNSRFQQDETSIENYEIYETLGDAVFKNFIVFYAAKRFDLYEAKDVKIISRIKINYGSDEEFQKTATYLNFLPYITASTHELNTNKNKILEDVFEAFLGVVCDILDTKFQIGVGYSICYDILKYINDKKNIPIEFEKLTDSVSLLKEFFDKNKEIGTLDYTYTAHFKNIYCKAFLIKPTGELEELGSALGTNKKESRQNAAKNALAYLQSNGLL
jgi:dsRNA-specific ribonuclease